MTVIQEHRYELYERVSAFVARAYLAEKGFELNFDMALTAKKLEVSPSPIPEESFLSIGTEFTLIYPRSYTGVITVDVCLEWFDLGDSLKLSEKGVVLISLPNHNDFSSTWRASFEVFFNTLDRVHELVMRRDTDLLKFVDIR